MKCRAKVPITAAIYVQKESGRGNAYVSGGVSRHGIGKSEMMAASWLAAYACINSRNQAA